MPDRLQFAEEMNEGELTTNALAATLLSDDRLIFNGTVPVLEVPLRTSVQASVPVPVAGTFNVAVCPAPAVQSPLQPTSTRRNCRRQRIGRTRGRWVQVWAAPVMLHSKPIGLLVTAAATARLLFELIVSVAGTVVAGGAVVGPLTTRACSSTSPRSPMPREPSALRSSYWSARGHRWKPTTPWIRCRPCRSAYTCRQPG